ncbi:MAG: hypothetical protein SGILL_004027 [Bacillariaceae sp.]
MEAAVILAILGKNMNVHGTTEMAMDIARVASKCVELRMAGCASLPSDWCISLDKAYRIFYCISSQGIGQILPQQIHQDITMAPVLAFQQLALGIKSFVENFYVREFQEPIGDLDCFLIVSVIQEKFQKDDGDTDEESNDEDDRTQGPNNTAPAA